MGRLPPTQENAAPTGARVETGRNVYLRGAGNYSSHLVRHRRVLVFVPSIVSGRGPT
jgi:hypothetical protein